MIDEHSESLKELTPLIGDAEAARGILLSFLAMAEIYGDMPRGTFTAKDGLTEGIRKTRLTATNSHLKALVPLLDDRLAWVTACYMPGFSDGPEIAEQNELRIREIQTQLKGLLADLTHALDRLPAVKSGRQFRATPYVMLMISLVAGLKEAGVKFSSAENSKLVRAVRICWSAAGFEGDPRDLVRTLAGRGGGK